jgi:hypothetical protein
MQKRTQTLEERFWPKVNKQTLNGCWEWTAAKYPAGYGVIGFVKPASPRPAHRVAWELVNGPIPEGLFVCHKCDNRACVNPDHLFLGTQKQNLADMAVKGRGTKSNRGEGSARSKLTTEQIIEIRRLSAEGISRAELGRRFGMRATSISRIVLRKRWWNVPEQ